MDKALITLLHIVIIISAAQLLGRKILFRIKCNMHIIRVKSINLWPSIAMLIGGIVVYYSMVKSICYLSIYSRTFMLLSCFMYFTYVLNFMFDFIYLDNYTHCIVRAIGGEYHYNDTLYDVGKNSISLYNCRKEHLITYYFTNSNFSIMKKFLSDSNYNAYNED